MARTIYKYFPGYQEACDRVRNGDLDHALAQIDGLFGREQLSYGASENQVKEEALRQLEIEFRNGEDDAANISILAGECARGVI